MTEPGYEYHGMLAQNWDLLRGDTSQWEDRGFYHEIIRETGQPVLDVGCGTGRLLLDYQIHPSRLNIPCCCPLLRDQCH